MSFVIARGSEELSVVGSSQICLNFPVSFHPRLPAQGLRRLTSNSPKGARHAPGITEAMIKRDLFEHLDGSTYVGARTLHSQPLNGPRWRGADRVSKRPGKLSDAKLGTFGELLDRQGLVQVQPRPRQHVVESVIGAEIFEQRRVLALATGPAQGHDKQLRNTSSHAGSIIVFDQSESQVYTGSRARRSPNAAIAHK